MNRNCDYTDEELAALLRGAQDEWEEALRCFFRGGQLKRETMAILLKAQATPHDAEESYSEGARVFFENIIHRKYLGGSSPKTYFFGICKNIWLDKKRGAWRRRTSFFENALDLDRLHTDTPDRKVEIESLERCIDQLLELTGERCREMYRLEIMGFSQAEIAEKTGQSSAANAKNAIYRCKRQLREIINGSPDLLTFFNSYLHGK